MHAQSVHKFTKAEYLAFFFTNHLLGTWYLLGKLSIGGWEVIGVEGDNKDSCTDAGGLGDGNLGLGASKYTSPTLRLAASARHRPPPPRLW